MSKGPEAEKGQVEVGCKTRAERLGQMSLLGAQVIPERPSEPQTGSLHPDAGHRNPEVQPHAVPTREVILGCLYWRLLGAGTSPSAPSTVVWPA